MPLSQVQQLKVHNPAVYERVFSLLAKAFPSLSLTMNGVRADLAPSEFEKEALYLGIWDKDKLISFNAFLPIWLSREGVGLKAYQSCYSATHPDYMRKGLFSQIQRTAREMLVQEDANLIFGFPNEASYPIFTGKLGFHSTRLHYSVRYRSIFQGKIEPSLYLPHKGQITAKMDHIISWKRIKYQNSLVDLHAENRLWGVSKRYKRWGMTVPYLAVGGIQVTNPETLEAEINRLAQKAGVRWVRMEFMQGHPLMQLLGNQKLKTQEVPFIWHSLNNNAYAAADFAFMQGIRDSF